MIKFLAVAFLLLAPFTTVFATAGEADCFVVSGAGNSSANGLYAYSGNYHGAYPEYENTLANGWFLAVDLIDSYYWVVREPLTGIGGDYESDYYTSDTFTDTPLTHTWANQTSFGGTSPAPTVTLGECEGGTDPEPTEGGITPVFLLTYMTVFVLSFYGASNIVNKYL